MYFAFLFHVRNNVRNRRQGSTLYTDVYAHGNEHASSLLISIIFSKLIWTHIVLYLQCSTLPDWVCLSGPAHWILVGTQTIFVSGSVWIWADRTEITNTQIHARTHTYLQHVTFTGFPISLSIFTETNQNLKSEKDSRRRDITTVIIWLLQSPFLVLFSRPKSNKLIYYG